MQRRNVEVSLHYSPSQVAVLTELWHVTPA